VYRYEFAKARHGRHFKVDCPSCGAIKRFNLFFDKKEDKLCDSQYGVCDRVNKCGHENRPKGQVILNQDEVKYVEKPMSVMPLDIVKKSLATCYSNTDPLTDFLRKYWGDNHLKALIAYNVVSVPFNGGFAPIFWFIDEFKKVRSGKIMNYHMVDGEPKRTKFDRTYKNIKWLHSRMDDFNFRMCSFGSHLLPLRPNDAVHIVESEKTALIMACVRPQHIWLATSSVTNLQEHILPNLKGRDVVLHPDKGERSFGYWKIKAKEFLNKNLVKSIKVSRFAEESEFLEEGDDIADYIIKAVKNESSKENQPRENSFYQH